MSKSSFNSSTCGCCGRLRPRKGGKARFCSRGCEWAGTRKERGVDQAAGSKVKRSALARGSE